MALKVVAGGTYERYNEVNVYEILLPARLSTVVEPVTLMCSCIDRPSRHEPMSPVRFAHTAASTALCATRQTSGRYG
jgi:hypothetical protein